MLYNMRVDEIIIGGRRLPVVITKKRVKNLSLRVREGRVLVSVPLMASMRQAESFIQSNRAFIEKQLGKEPSARSYIQGFETLYLGEPISVKSAGSSKNAAILGGGVLTLYSKKMTEDALERQFYGWLQERAVTVAREEVERLLPLFYSYRIPRPTVDARRMKSRWGSCNLQKKHIRFNSLLVCAPQSCIRYIAAHELSHLVASGHGERFYAVLSSVIPDYKNERKKLRALSEQLIR